MFIQKCTEKGNNLKMALSVPKILSNLGSITKTFEIKKKKQKKKKLLYYWAAKKINK